MATLTTFRHLENKKVELTYKKMCNPENFGTLTGNLVNLFSDEKTASFYFQRHAAISNLFKLLTFEYMFCY